MNNALVFSIKTLDAKSRAARISGPTGLNTMPVEKGFTDTRHNHDNICVVITTVEQGDLFCYVSGAQLASLQYCRTALDNDTFWRNNNLMFELTEI